MADLQKLIKFPVYPFIVHDTSLGPAITSKADLESKKGKAKKKSSNKDKPLPIGQSTIISFISKMSNNLFEDLDEIISEQPQEEYANGENVYDEQVETNHEEGENVYDEGEVVYDEVENGEGENVYEEGAAEEQVENGEYTQMDEDRRDEPQTNSDEAQSQQPGDAPDDGDDEEFLLKPAYVKSPATATVKQKQPVLSDDDVVFDKEEVNNKFSRLKKGGESVPTKSKPESAPKKQEAKKPAPTKRNMFDSDEEDEPQQQSKTQHIDQDPPMINKNSIKGKSKQSHEHNGHKSKAVEEEPKKHNKQSSKPAKDQPTKQDKKRKEPERNEDDDDDFVEENNMADYDNALESILMNATSDVNRLLQKQQRDAKEKEVHEKSSKEKSKSKKSKVESEMDISQNGMKNIPKPDTVPKSTKKKESEPKSKNKSTTPRARTNKTQISAMFVDNISKSCSSHTRSVANKTKEPFYIMDLIDPKKSKQENEKVLTDFIYNGLLWTFHYMPQTVKTTYFSKNPYDVKMDPNNIESFRTDSSMDALKLYYAAVAPRSDVNLDHHSKDEKQNEISF